uniref:uncharacterized protein LOC113475638 n=1 Tax=Ciona intestinalis TaxID=7719 RepID=UPI000EF53AFF|nr:uncharacterized protein LOC113475638 [Ciona intestinalis]|eukprot:XP_026695850.1 uncharacterized protein LOC113475638 [Ciona intestinalis]
MLDCFNLMQRSIEEQGETKKDMLNILQFYQEQINIVEPLYLQTDEMLKPYVLNHQLQLEFYLKQTWIKFKKYINYFSMNMWILCVINLKWMKMKWPRHWTLLLMKMIMKVTCGGDSNMEFRSGEMRTCGSDSNIDFRSGKMRTCGGDSNIDFRSGEMRTCGGDSNIEVRSGEMRTCGGDSNIEFRSGEMRTCGGDFQHRSLNKLGTRFRSIHFINT